VQPGIIAFYVTLASLKTFFLAVKRFTVEFNDKIVNFFIILRCFLSCECRNV